MMTRTLLTTCLIGAILLSRVPASYAAGAPCPETTATILPNVDATGTSPSVTRAGYTIPLRPEMLTERQTSITIPTVFETTLPQGIHFFSYESHDLPCAYFTLLIKAGKTVDPPDQVGLADVTANSLRSGGSGKLSPDEFDRQLENLGSDLQIGVERDYIRVEMFTLAANMDASMKLLADMLLEPAFDDKRVELQKSRLIESVRRESDEPADLSRREFRKLIYGANHPLARTPGSKSVNSITRKNVVEFYDKYYRPSSTWFGVSGDISKDDAQKLIEKHFSKWTKPAAELPPIPAVSDVPLTGTAVTLLEKDTAQAQIRIGHVGTARHIPEQYAITVLNAVYGTAGFSCRLMNEVRTKRGYVYGVGGGIFPDEPKGLFVAVGSSKSKTTAAAIETMIQVTRDLLTSGVTTEEMELAKRDTIYSFVTGFDTPKEIVSNYMTYNLLGYPGDYIQNYPKNIQAVSDQEVEAAARKFIHPDGLRIFVIGKPAAFDKPLAQFGPVSGLKLEEIEPVKPSTDKEQPALNTISEPPTTH